MKQWWEIILLVCSHGPPTDVSEGWDRPLSHREVDGAAKFWTGQTAVQLTSALPCQGTWSAPPQLCWGGGREAPRKSSENTPGSRAESGPPLWVPAQEGRGSKSGFKPSQNNETVQWELLSKPFDSTYVERGAASDSGGRDDEVQDQHCGSGEANAEEPGAAMLYDGVYDVLQAQRAHSVQPSLSVILIFLSCRHSTWSWCSSPWCMML